MGTIDNANNTTKLGLCRFNADGSLDTSFNSSGYLVIPQQTPSYWSYKMIKLSDDSFIINERKYVTNHYEYDLIKFNSTLFLLFLALSNHSTIHPLSLHYFKNPFS
jgi:hypothetical protein